MLLLIPLEPGAGKQGFGWDSVSGRPVTNLGPEGLSHQGGGGVGACLPENVPKLKRFLVHFPRFSADKFNVSIELE